MSQTLLRRKLLRNGIIVSAAVGTRIVRPGYVWGQADLPQDLPGGRGVIDFSVQKHRVPIAGRMGTVVSANRTAPAPLLRFREGEEVTVNVKNEMTDESLRLRVINAGAMTIFDVRIPGLKMTVVHADGQDVEPVEVDEFRMGAAETYDVIVQPKEDKAYTIFAEPMDRSDFAAATLAPRKGMRGPLPPRRKRPLRTMKDMGMVHAGAHGGMNHGATDHGAMKSPQEDGPAKTAGHQTTAAPAGSDSHAGHRMPDEPKQHEAHAAKAPAGASQSSDIHAAHTAAAANPAKENYETPPRSPRARERDDRGNAAEQARRTWYRP